MVRIRQASFLFLVPFALLSCGSGNGKTDDAPKAPSSAIVATWALSGRLERSPQTRAHIDDVFKASVSECSWSAYLPKAKMVVTELFPRNVPASARPTDAVLKNECLVRASVKIGDCDAVERSRRSDCESLLEMKKRISDWRNPFTKPADSETYVRYFLDAGTYPPEKYLK